MIYSSPLLFSPLKKRTSKLMNASRNHIICLTLAEWQEIDKLLFNRVNALREETEHLEDSLFVPDKAILRRVDTELNITLELLEKIEGALFSRGIMGLDALRKIVTENA